MFKRIHSIFHRHYYTRYHGIYHHAKQLFVFDMALLGIATLMLGAGLFFFFWKPGVTDLVDLSISLGENRIRSGEMVHVTADYTNRSKHTLENASLALHLPAGFVVDRNRTLESTFSKNSLFTLGALEPGAKGQMEIFGKFWSEPNTNERIIGTLTYLDKETGRTEQKLSAFITSLTDSVLETHLTVATTTFPNTPSPFTFTIKNTSDEEIRDIQFGAVAKEITFDDKSNGKTFNLKSGEIKEVKGKVTLAIGTKTFSFVLTPQVHINNKIFSQAPAKETVNLFSPLVSVRARLPSSVAYANPGSEIPVEISWSNYSTKPLTNLRIRLTFSPAVVDIRTTARLNNLKSDGSALIIDKSIRTRLAGGSGAETFTINLKLLSSFNTSEQFTRLTIYPVMEAEMDEVPGQTFTQTGDSASTPLATELTLSAQPRYYTAEGDQLGRGPLPPTVGEATKYWIFVQANNTANPVRDAAFSTTLPAGVAFTGKQSVTIGSPLRYNASNKTISWSYNELPAHSQTGLYFEVEVTPTPEQVGKILQLTRGLQFSGTDAVVGKEFTLTRAGLTNVLPTNDPGSQRGAQVVTE